MNICFDVNAVIYLHTDAPQQGETLFAYDIALTRGYEAYVPACSPADIHYILHRNGLSGDGLEQPPDALFEMFHVYDVTCDDGIRVHRNGMGDFEDALIAESAAHNGMDIIITYNLRGFREPPVQAMSPAQFAEAFKTADLSYGEWRKGEPGEGAR